jgi:NAD+ synthase (glutamine-hydrolysing)
VKKTVRLGAACTNITPLDWEGNRRVIAAAISHAKGQGVQLLCLPELCISGYGCEDQFLSTGTVALALQNLRELLSETHGIAVTLGLPISFTGHIYNCAAVVVDGVIQGIVPKQNLAREGLHYEQRWFSPWQPGHISSTADEYPFGDLIFEIDGVKVGIEICEDAWVTNRPAERLRKRGVDIILNGSASHFAFQKHLRREELVKTSASQFKVHYVYANLVGCESGRVIYDGDCLIASKGEIVASGSRLTFNDFALTVADVQVENICSSASSDLENGLVVVPDFKFRSPSIKLKSDGPALWQQEVDRKEQEFLRVISLGLFDYLRKSHSRGFVVSLSGGADSSAASYLVAAMCKLAVHELGIAEFLAKLPQLEMKEREATTENIMKRMLTCVYQGSDQSSLRTREAARQVAKALSASWYEVEISSLVAAYVATVERSLARPLTWENDDLALQNIQARARAPMAWLFANVRGALLLNTGNRSEAAVGYATMDGDTAGGLSPLGGIDKAYLRKWLQWAEKKGPQEIGPVPELKLVNDQIPTAELRPAEKNQSDEGDLMPYEVLDLIERYSIRDKLLPLPVFLKMRTAFKDKYSEIDLKAWVEKFFVLWCRNQWKRERYAPSFHVDDENLDPRSWCRFPILSGGFERELKELRAWSAT